MRKMQDAIANADFDRDIQSIRRELDDDKPVLNERTLALIKKYNLPRLCFVFIRDYILSGGFGPAEMLPAPITLLSFKDGYVGPDYEVPLAAYLKAFPNDHVVLDLTGEIQKQDLLDFVRANWDLIEAKLKLVEPARPGAVKMKQMDKKHAEVVRLREQEKLSYTQIAVKTNLTKDNVSKILYRERKPRKVDTDIK